MLVISSELLTSNMTASPSGMFQTCNIGILGGIVPFLVVSNRRVLFMSTGLIIEQIHCN